MNDNLLRCPKCLRVIETPLDSTSRRFRCKKCKVFFEPQGPDDSDFELKTPSFKDMSNEFLDKAKDTGKNLPQNIKSKISKSIKDWISENFPEEHREYMLKDLKLRIFSGIGYGIAYGLFAFIASVFAVSVILTLISPLIYTKSKTWSQVYYKYGKFWGSSPVWESNAFSGIVEFFLLFIIIGFTAYFLFRGFLKGFYTDMSERLNKDEET